MHSSWPISFSPEEHFATVARELLNEPGVTLPEDGTGKKGVWLVGLEDAEQNLCDAGQEAAGCQAASAAGRRAACSGRWSAV